MKSSKYHSPIFLFLLGFSLAFGQTASLPNDCSNALTVCGGGTLSSNATGVGVQELNVSNTCDSQENNSLWLKINIATSGTLGFTLRPTSSDIVVDYDFFVFGPNASCNNLGPAIRCSTTNPQAANQGNNLTGMNGSETDTSEDPGPDGNSFVKWLDVIAGQSYFIVIDRPVGNSTFDLEWTGSATTGGSAFPSAPLLSQLPDQKICNDTGTYVFNLSTFKNQINANLTNAITFHASNADAVDGVNALSNNYTVTLSSKKIFVRVTNGNGCFSITDFNIAVYKNPIASNYTLSQCDVDPTNSIDNKTAFNLQQAFEGITGGNSGLTVSYYESTSDRNNNKPIANLVGYIGRNNQIIYTKTVNTNGCERYAQLLLEVSPTTASLPVRGPYFSCDIDPYDAMLEGIFDLEAIRTNSYPNLDVAFFASLEAASLELNPISGSSYLTGPMTVFVRIEDNNACQGIEQFDLIVDETPKVNIDKEFIMCLNNPVLNITTEDVYDLYSWIKTENDGSEITISNTQNATIDQIGNYILVLTKYYSNPNRTCTNAKEFKVVPSNIASFNPQPQIKDILDNNIVTVFAEGEGNYEFSIDGIDYQDSNVFENVPSGFATVYIRDKNNCGIVSKRVSIIGYSKFFTPNSDGINDYWQLRGVDRDFQPESFIYIFDRYGKLLKQLDPQSIGWDGSFNGMPLPASDYWFKVNLEDGREFKGHFALKR